MDNDLVRAVLIGALLLNAALGLGYRIYRLFKQGPLSDVIGQAILGALLLLCAFGVAAASSWAQWGALAYGLLFGIVVMPVWTLAVLIPLRPQLIDYAFTGVYWSSLALIVVASLAL